MLNILLITTKASLVDHFKPFGNVIHMTSIADAQELIETDELDVVVVSQPYSREQAKTIKHQKVKYVSNNEELKLLKTAFVSEKQRRERLAADPPKRKLRVDGQRNVDFSQADKPFLLVSTNTDLIREFNVFPNCDVVTNGYTARRYIHQRQYTLVVWDLAIDLPRISIPAYRWGEAVKSQKDIYLLLITGQLSIHEG